MTDIPTTSINDLLAVAYGPRMEHDYGMTLVEVSAYVAEHGHLPPLADGFLAGALPCEPFHMGCEHRCEEHPR